MTNAEEVATAVRRRSAEMRAQSNGQASDAEFLPAPESWAAVDLGPVLRGEVASVEYTIFSRDDRVCLFPRGRVCSIHGDSGIGKSIVAAVAAAQLLTADGHVIWIDFEDPDATTLVERLRMLGVTDKQIDARLHYHGPTEPFSPLAVELILDECREHDVALIVVDSLGEAFGLEGINENSDDEVGPWLRRVTRPLANAGPCVLIVDHGTKAGDNKLHASGSKRKRAAITGTSYLIEAPKPLNREHGGRLQLTCAKDRHGHFRRSAVAATVHLTRNADGEVTVQIWPPSSPTSARPEDRVDDAAWAAVRATKHADHPLSTNELERLMDIKASATIKRAGIDLAVDLKAIRTEAGIRKSVLHHYVKDLDPGGSP